MNLIRSYDDEALKLPLLDLEVYYTDDDKYKVLISSPLNSRPDMRYISINHHPHTDAYPGDDICNEILDTLGMAGAMDTNPALANHFVKGVRRYLKLKGRKPWQTV
jgi:hypothetical protein